MHLCQRDNLRFKRRIVHDFHQQFLSRIFFISAYNFNFIPKYNTNVVRLFRVQAIPLTFNMTRKNCAEYLIKWKLPQIGLLKKSKLKNMRGQIKTHIQNNEAINFQITFYNYEDQ